VNSLLVSLSDGWSWFLGLSEDLSGLSDSSSDDNDSSVNSLANLNSLDDLLGDLSSDDDDSFVDDDNSSVVSSPVDDLLFVVWRWLLLVESLELSKLIMNLFHVVLSVDDQLGLDEFLLKNLLVLWSSLMDLLLVNSDSIDVLLADSLDDLDLDNLDCSLLDNLSGGNLLSDLSDLLSSDDLLGNYDSLLDDSDLFNDSWFLGLLGDSFVSSVLVNQFSDVSSSVLDDLDSDDSVDELGLVLRVLGLGDLLLENTGLMLVLLDESLLDNSSNSLSLLDGLALEDLWSSVNLLATSLLGKVEELLVSLLDEWLGEMSLGGSVDSSGFAEYLLDNFGGSGGLSNLLQSIELGLVFSNNSLTINLNLNLDVFNFGNELLLNGGSSNLLLGLLEIRELLGKDFSEVGASLGVSLDWLLGNLVLSSDKWFSPLFSDDNDFLGVSTDSLLECWSWLLLVLLLQVDDLLLGIVDVFWTLSDQDDIDDLSSDDLLSSQGSLWRSDNFLEVDNSLSASSDELMSSSSRSPDWFLGGNSLSGILLLGVLLLDDLLGSLDLFLELLSLSWLSLLELLFEFVNLSNMLSDNILWNDSLSVDDSVLDVFLDGLSIFVVDWSSSPLLDEDESLSVLANSLLDDDLLGWFLDDDLSQSLDFLGNLLLIFLTMLDDLGLDNLLIESLSLSLVSSLLLSLPSDDLVGPFSHDNLVDDSIGDN